MVPIPSQVEVDLCRLEDYPLGPPRRPCSAGGKVAGNSGHDFRASGAFVCWSVFSFKWQDNIFVILLIANGLVRHCSGDFVAVFPYVEELFMSRKGKKKKRPLSSAISLIIIRMKQCEHPCSWNTNPYYRNYLHIVRIPPH